MKLKQKNYVLFQDILENGLYEVLTHENAEILISKFIEGLTYKKIAKKYYLSERSAYRVVGKALEDIVSNCK